MQYWLMKSEPSTYGIDHLRVCLLQSDSWEGVRNYQARNYMRDVMKVGDRAFFYHSNCSEPGIVGIIEIIQDSHPDKTALDPNSKYYDPKSTSANPRWFMVRVKLLYKFAKIVSLAILKKHPKLVNMQVNKKGNRLSITPVKAAEWQTILELANYYE